jgi:integrase
MCSNFRLPKCGPFTGLWHFTMNKVSFHLKDPSSAKDTAIYVRYMCSDGRLKYYPKLTTPASTWPATNKGIAAKLTTIKQAIEKAEVDYNIKHEPLTKKIVTAILDRALVRKVKGSSLHYFDQLDHLIDKMEEGKIVTPRNKKYTASTIKTFRFTRSVLERFQPGMRQETISLDTYDQFIKWCHDQQLSTNYIGAQIKNWMRLGKLLGGNDIFYNAGFKKIQEPAMDVYLDEKELEAMFKLKLSSRMAHVRDWFILDCYTGLRVSDLLLLSNRNYSKGYITIANKKTSEKVVLPVHPYVKSIMDKYKGFPPKVSDVEINRIIKKVAEKADITDRVLHTITKGGRRQDTYLTKWEMISCHTARRSFITNLRKNGVPDTIVMNLTGIKSAQTLQKYDKLTPDEAAKIAAGLNFFK